MSAVRFWAKRFEAAGKMSLRASLLVGIGLLLGAAVLDWKTGPELASAIFYLVPICWVTWKGGRWAGLAAALGSGACWLAVVMLTNRRFSSDLIPYWNAFVRTTSFCLISSLESEVLARIQAQRRLRLANEDLERQARILAEVSDREQRRLGEDLHDGLCQHLVSTAFAARRLAGSLAARNLPQAQDAAEIAELLGASISQARDVARGLCLVPMEIGGLASALEDLVTQVRSQHWIACELVEGASIPVLAETVGTNLFRITQEAVRNAVKHAQASQIRVTLAADAREVWLHIEDNGVGLQPDFAATCGIGLRIMNYRARIVGARLTVGPRQGGGTLVTCSVRRPDATVRNDSSPG